MSDLEDLLVKSTGEGRQFWMDWIGNKIPAYTDSTRATQSDLWLRDLAQEVFARMKTRFDLTRLDENIICSIMMSLILTLWSCRLTRAKAYDARRPLEDRQGMMNRLVVYHKALLECMTDESKDPDFFPKQEWTPPFNTPKE